MKTLLVLVAALALAAPALADSEAIRLEPAASFAAGKPVKVMCAHEYGEGGHAWPGSQTVYLDFSLCATLLGRLARTGDDVSPGAMAASLLVLAHEAQHAAGFADESAADCAALRVLPGMASRFFGYRTWRSRHDLMGLAWASHNESPPVYRTRC